jgi:DamX protein
MGVSDYLQETGLSADPFADVEDETLFFETPQLTQRLNLVHHLVRYSDLLLLVTGPTGAGKTTLFNQLTADPAEPWHVSVVEADVEIGAQRLWQKALEGFDIPPPEAAGGRPTALKPYLERWHRRAQTAVLAIDEAHLLPRPALSAVLRAAGEMAELRLRIVLLGEPQLEQLLTDITYHGPRRTIVHVVDVPPLTELQTAEYIGFRLRRAGLEESGLFPATTVRRLHRECEGLPGALNQRARDILANRLAAGEPPSPETAPTHEARRRRRRVGLPAILALVTVAGLLSWLALGPTGAPPPESLPLPPPAEPRITPSPPVSERPPAPDIAAPVRHAPPAPVRVIPLTAPAPEPPEGGTPGPSATAPEAEPAETVAKETPAKPTPSEKTIVAQAPATAERPTAAFPSAGPGDAWLLAQKPEQYTVQLTGTRERQAALDFIGDHGLAGKAVWFRTLHQKQDWYVVVSGVYPSRDAAVEGIAKLPETLRRHRPWSRSFASIQQSIRDAGGTP